MCILGNKVLILKRVMQLFILQQLKGVSIPYSGKFSQVQIFVKMQLIFFRVSPNYN